MERERKIVAKKFVRLTFSSCVVLLLAIAVVTIVVDPFFHFHKPIQGMHYYLDDDNERYFNDGILRHFDYDTIITGSSMTENFKATEVDEVFGVRSIKVPYSGATFEELAEAIGQGISYHPSTKMVICSLDTSNLLGKRNELYEAPTYLTDNNPFNDVKYLFNKDIFMNYVLQDIIGTLRGDSSTDFDAYANWMKSASFGTWANSYVRSEPVQTQRTMTNEEREYLAKHLEDTILESIQQYSDTQFYLFFPPYSVLSWDRKNQAGELEFEIEQLKLASAILTQYPNVHLFSFWTETEIYTNLMNYKDAGHYGEDINSWILGQMKKEANRISYETVDEVWEEQERLIKLSIENLDE